MNNGLGQFANWLTMKYDQLDRKEVVAALQYESVREIALSRLKHLENQISELRELMREAVTAAPMSDPTDAEMEEFAKEVLAGDPLPDAKWVDADEATEPRSKECQ